MHILEKVGQDMTREEFKEEAKKVIDTERFGILGALFEYESFEEMKVAHIPNDSCSAESDMSLDDFLDKLYERIKQETVLDKIRAEIAEYGSICVAYAITDKTKTDEGIKKLVSDVLKQAKEQVLDIIDKYRAETEEEDD